MGFSYFGEHQYWKHITRDERTFCAELYFTIKGNENKFIKWLKNNLSIDCITDDELAAEWEAGYEVCFYRDFIKVLGEKNGNRHIKKSDSKHSIKRTFDLCLFSEKKLLIFEAKSHKGFQAKQNKEFEKDAEAVQLLIGNHVDVCFIAIYPSTYLINVQKRGKIKSLPDIFKGRGFSWLQVNELAQNPMFIRADNCYNDNYSPSLL